MTLDMLDEISLTVSGARAEISARVPEDLYFFSGHFPGFPLVPAFMQLQWIAAAAAKCFGLEALRAVEAAKFTKPIGPGARINFQLVWNEEREVLKFSLRTEDGEAASGRMSFPVSAAS